MSRKVKCRECILTSRWSLPDSVNENNIDYAKLCLLFAQNTLVCDHTMKTKKLAHEQYCKYYQRKDEVELKMDELYEQKEINKLRDLINDYESKGEQR